MIIIYLSAEQQGVWYTFGSLAALSGLAELGFTLLISQLVSHEFSSLSLKKGFVIGKSSARDKLFSLIRFSLKMYIFIIPAACIILTLGGTFILIDQPHEIRLAWIIFSIISALSLLVSLFQSIYQGLDKISEVYKARTIGTLIIPSMGFVLLIFDFYIWALIIPTLVSILVMLLLLFKVGVNFWIQVWRHKQKLKFNWKKEVINLQTKYAISWFSGDAIFSLFVPLTFKVLGPEQAGQLGLLISLSTGITYLSTSWLDALIPKMNILVAKRNKNELDRLYIGAIIRGYLLFIVGALSLVCLVYLSQYFQFYNDRILSIDLVILYLISELAIVKIGFLAKYLRAHRAEPFYLLSLVNGLLVAGLLLWGLPQGLYIIFCGLILVYWLAILPGGFIIYRNFVKTYYLKEDHES